jgi:protease-4
MQKSTKWFLVGSGIVAFLGLWLFLIAFLVLKGLTDSDVEITSGSGGRIAVVNIQGTILTSEDVVRQLRKYGDDRSIRAVILRIDSPGGGVVASQEMYEEARRMREAGKPVVVSMGSLAASGGYYVACGASKIVANRGTLTGSIGVISQFMRVDPLLDKIGIEPHTIKSGKLKDAGSPFRKMTAEDEAYFQRIMDEVHRQFISVVERERHIAHDSLVAYADGRVFTGEEALGLRLVDTLGTFQDAVDLAARLAGLHGEPTLVRERKATPLFEQLFGKSELSAVLGLKDEILNRPLLQYRMPEGF